ncbi:hypothetical protein E2C01_010317 [Portunus trituberculatus]|uniref:Uncharacterized protein n=1 Tax=Portunus trituberculatus TaxID=210409 RepID=A0A5B7D840_PORTR|nr:hypothetical protein [Portunus trituberculatus]
MRCASCLRGIHLVWHDQHGISGKVSLKVVGSSPHLRCGPKTQRKGENTVLINGVRRVYYVEVGREILRQVCINHGRIEVFIRQEGSQFCRIDVIQIKGVLLNTSPRVQVKELRHGWIGCSGVGVRREPSPGEEHQVELETLGFQGKLPAGPSHKQVKNSAGQLVTTHLLWLTSSIIPQVL